MDLRIQLISPLFRLLARNQQQLLRLMLLLHSLLLHFDQIIAMGPNNFNLVLDFLVCFVLLLWPLSINYGIIQFPPLCIY